MNVAPLAVFQTLKAMCASQRIADTSMGDSSTASYPNTTTTASSASNRTQRSVNGQYQGLRELEERVCGFPFLNNTAFSLVVQPEYIAHCFLYITVHVCRVGTDREER